MPVTITISIPDEQIGRIRQAYAIAYNKPLAEINAAFVKQDLAAHIKQVVKSAEAEAAEKAARDAASAAVEAEVDLS